MPLAKGSSLATFATDAGSWQFAAVRDGCSNVAFWHNADLLRCPLNVRGRGANRTSARRARLKSVMTLSWNRHHALIYLFLEHDLFRKPVSTLRDHASGPCGATFDEGQRGPRTVHWVAGSRVIGIPRKDEKLGVRDHPLPGCGFLDTGEPAPISRDDQGRTRNFRHVGPDVGACDRLHESDLGRDSSLAHQSCPPLHAGRRKVAAEPPAHAFSGPGFDAPLFEIGSERRGGFRRADAQRRW